jgi:hypothetical protein
VCVALVLYISGAACLRLVAALRHQRCHQHQGFALLCYASNPVSWVWVRQIGSLTACVSRAHAPLGRCRCRTRAGMPLFEHRLLRGLQPACSCLECTAWSESHISAEVGRWWSFEQDGFCCFCCFSGLVLSVKSSLSCPRGTLLAAAFLPYYRITVSTIATIAVPPPPCPASCRHHTIYVTHSSKCRGHCPI